MKAGGSLRQAPQRSPSVVASPHCGQSAAGKAGSIVNIASILGERVSGGVAPYAISKAGVIQATKVMALELARHGIRVNAISPGMVPTESFYRVLQFTDADMPKLAATVPLGRMGTPEDMAAGVLYLASPAAGWVTGQNILIGGGRDGGKSVEHR